VDGSARFFTPLSVGERARRPGIGGGVGTSKREIKHAFEFSGAVREAVVPGAHVIARPEELVGNIQRRQNGNLQTVALWTLTHGEAHFLIHVRSELGDIGLLERTPHWISLSVNLDVDDSIRHH